MTTKEAISYFGGVRQLATFIGVWPQAIYLWGEYPPIGKQYELQVRTNNNLLAEVATTAGEHV